MQCFTMVVLLGRSTSTQHYLRSLHSHSFQYAMFPSSAYLGGICTQTKTDCQVATSMRRAGADVIISYFTPKLLNLIKS